MTDAFGVDRPDLEIVKAGKHVYDPDSPSSKAANKKHKGKFHPAFVAHIGAHSFDHSAKDIDEDKKSPEIEDDAESDNTGPRKFPPKKGHKPKKGVPAAFADSAFGKLASSPPNARRNNNRSTVLHAAGYGATGAAFAGSLVKPGSSATDHLIRSTKFGGAPKSGMLGSPTRGTSATGAGVHAFKTAEPGASMAGKLGRAGGAFARGIPKSPGAAIAAGGLIGGAAIGGAIVHNRKKQAAPAAIGKAEEYTSRKTLRAQGMSFSDKAAARSVGRDARLRGRMFLAGPNRKENWKTTGKHVGAGAGVGAAVGGALGASHGGAKGALAGAIGGADIGSTVGGLTGLTSVASRASHQAVQRGIKSGKIKTGVPESQIRRNGLPKKPKGDFGKAYQPGTITYHQEQANLHARKKTAAGKRGEGFATAAGLGVAGGAAVHAAAPKIARAVVKPASEVGTLGHELQAAKLAPKIARGARIGGLGILGTGAALAGASAAQRVHHGNKQNKHVKLAQAARTERNAGLKKSYTPPLPGLESSFGERTVDGMPETYGSFIERIEPVEKNYYYGSAPTQKEHKGATASAGAFGGAVTGATLGPQLKKDKLVAAGSKLRNTRIALKTVR